MFSKVILEIKGYKKQMHFIKIKTFVIKLIQSLFV